MKTLVLDLDETLVHSVMEETESASYSFQVNFLYSFIIN